MNRCISLKNRDGFTLIEIIITLIVVSIMGAMLVSYIGNVLTKSAQPLTTSLDSQTAGSCMDAVVQYYRDSFYNSGGPLYNVSDIAAQIGNNRFAGRCPGMTINSSWVVYNPATNAIAAGTGAADDMLQVNVSGTSGVSYSMLFSSKR